MAEKLPISNIILKIISEKRAFSEDDLLNQIEIRLKMSPAVPQDKPYYGITRSVRNLVTMGHIEPFNAGQSLFLRITPLGKQKLISNILDSKTNLAPIDWDGNWRMVLLDLPESRKSEREAVRYLLRKAGFYCLKNSVWVSPYPFEHICSDIKKFFELKEEMSIVIAKAIDDDTEAKLRKIFKLI